MSRPRAWIAVGVTLVTIAALTLRPLPEPPPSGDLTQSMPPPLLCLACGDNYGVDVILNVLLFIPLGMTLMAAMPPKSGRWWRASAIACAVSILIEMLQFTVITGRDSTISDVVTNTVGAMLGAALVMHHRTLLAPSRRSSRVLSVFSAIAALAVMTGTAALLRPSMPYMGLWGQWTPQKLSFEPYAGTLHRFEVDGIAVPYGLVPEWERLRHEILDGTFEAQATFTAGVAPDRLSAIARLGSRFQEVILVGARGNALVYRTRLATKDWGLRFPAIAVPGALTVRGERVDARVGLRPDGWFAAVSTPRGVFERHVPFSVALGWTFVLPFDRPLVPFDRGFSALWLAALALPAAWWGAMARGVGGRSGRPGLWWGGVMLALAAGLVFVPRWAMFAPAPPSEWLGLVAGGVGGVWLATVARRRSDGVVSP